MDNLITSLIAVAIFLAFVIGLAVSIKSIPFAIIITVVSLLVLVEFYQSAREGLAEEKQNKT